MSDALLSINNDQYYDCSIGENGDIEQVDFFDTAIMVSIYENRRAAPEEIPFPEFRRGWIGNESTPDFERGSKIWLYSQSRLNRDIINSIIAAADGCLQWMITEGYATKIVTDVDLRNAKVFLLITITRPDSTVIGKDLFLWDNSGITEA